MKRDPWQPFGDVVAFLLIAVLEGIGWAVDGLRHPDLGGEE